MIFRRFIAYLSILLTLIACSKFRGPKKPDNLISKEKMVAILIDAKLLSSSSSINKNIMKSKGVDLDNYIYIKHNIDSLQFVLSNNYYAFHIKDYEAIYQKVTDSLEALKIIYKDIEAKEWKEKTKGEEDSLKKVLEKKKDTLQSLNIIDSTKAPFLKRKFKKTNLIEPVSNTDFQ